jgi:hypothetical protein
MNWQSIIVYVILIGCAVLIVFNLWRTFTKKPTDENKCATCNYECDLKKKSGK